VWCEFWREGGAVWRIHSGYVLDLSHRCRSMTEGRETRKVTKVLPLACCFADLTKGYDQGSPPVFT